MHSDAGYHSSRRLGLLWLLVHRRRTTLVSTGLGTELLHELELAARLLLLKMIVIFMKSWHKLASCAYVSSVLLATCLELSLFYSVSALRLPPQCTMTVSGVLF